MTRHELEHLSPEGFARQGRAAKLEDEIACLASHIHAATYRLIAMLRVFDELDGWQGWPTPAHWLQWRCGFSLNASREKFRVARALPGLPRIRAAFKKGELSFAQVRAATRIATPDNEATVLMWARHSTASHMEKLARLYRRHGENAAAMAQHRERSFSYREEEDGMVSFRIRLPAEQAAVVLKAVEAAKEGADRRVDQASEDANREIRRLESRLSALTRQVSEAGSLAQQAKANLDLFQQQYDAGQRQVMDVVGVYETFAARQSRQVELKYELAEARVQLAKTLGLLADGSEI